MTARDGQYSFAGDRRAHDDGLQTTGPYGALRLLLFSVDHRLA
jgi:hypothetical protein